MSEPKSPRPFWIKQRGSQLFRTRFKRGAGICNRSSTVRDFPYSLGRPIRTKLQKKHSKKKTSQTLPRTEIRWKIRKTERKKKPEKRRKLQDLRKHWTRHTNQKQKTSKDAERWGNIDNTLKTPAQNSSPPKIKKRRRRQYFNKRKLKRNDTRRQMKKHPTQMPMQNRNKRATGESSANRNHVLKLKPNESKNTKHATTIAANHHAEEELHHTGKTIGAGLFTRTDKAHDPGAIF